ncbi:MULTISPECIES: hypothetical protein [Streptomyces]|uniref:DUF7848 domain-containing protein n=1 Tax=Streptomyces TaxID=1883 RepID=UPI001661D650|nr:MULTISPECIES: hypothetical protein [Streptomyces]MBD0839026.1 hypothetical protein [Streptomyces sp. TRM68416]GGS83971.1 hypothetical protein GCM10010222_26890 [Streptomyces tanashiensis]
MSTRAVYRYVPHTIQHAPESGITAELFCTSIGCGESSGPQADPETAQDWALRHTGLNPGHDLFRREYTDHARVTRADPTPAR